MWVVLIALRRPYTFVVLALLIAIFGTLSAVRTPVDIFPNINIPVISVVWTYNGLLPNDMSGRVVYYYERTLTSRSETSSTSIRSPLTATASSRSSFKRTSTSQRLWHR